MEKKWFHTEIHKTDPDENALRLFCNVNGIYYEPSDAGFGYTHFAIHCDKATADRIESEMLHFD